jgi:hypothetical protein
VRDDRRERAVVVQEPAARRPARRRASSAGAEAPTGGSPRGVRIFSALSWRSRPRGRRRRPRSPTDRARCSPPADHQPVQCLRRRPRPALRGPGKARGRFGRVVGVNRGPTARLPCPVATGPRGLEA